MPTKLTPEGTRRPEIRARALVLADGQAWGFALPMARLEPRISTIVDDRGRLKVCVVVRSVVAYPVDILRLREETRLAIVNGCESKRLAAFFELAATLLCAAHKIDESTVRVLLDLNENLPRFVSDLLDIAFASTRGLKSGP